MSSTVLWVGPYLRIRRFWQAPTENFWDRLWENTPTATYWSESLAGGGLGEYAGLYERTLPPAGAVLEAGCGAGQVVLGLRARGYDAHGLDNAPRVIEVLREAFPEVPFDLGDIRSLPYEDASFDGYVSLGVIEHFTSGQLEILREAHRVLRPRGHVFISVPAVNGFRRLRARLGRYRDSSDAPFFEDCYSEEELVALIDEAGFEVGDVVYTNPVMTFVQETFLRRPYRFIEDKPRIRALVDRILRRILPRRWFGHMIMVVGQKRAR